MTVRATYFHPDVITFRWFCQGGELSPVASQASSSPRPDSEGFFSAYSQCKLPKSELEKGSTKVWVSVHHIALKQPITRETRGEKQDKTVPTSCCKSHTKKERFLVIFLCFSVPRLRQETMCVRNHRLYDFHGSDCEPWV